MQYYIKKIKYYYGRQYIIEKSTTTNRWHYRVDWLDSDGNVQCSSEGWDLSKRDAKRRAREQESPCIPGIPLERGETSIGPPDIDAQVEDGQLVEFSIKDLSEIEHLFTTTDIDQNAALWLFGMNCFDPDLSEDWELVKALLKVWGLYIGGSTETEIKSQHNLCDDDITLLAHRNWNCIEFICDQAGVYHWNFVDSPDDLLDNED